MRQHVIIICLLAICAGGHISAHAEEPVESQVGLPTPALKVFDGVVVDDAEGNTFYRVANEDDEPVVRDVITMAGPKPGTTARSVLVFVRWFSPKGPGRVSIWAETQTGEGVERAELGSSSIANTVPNEHGWAMTEVRLDWPEDLAPSCVLGLSAELGTGADVGLGVAVQWEDELVRSPRGSDRPISVISYPRLPQSGSTAVAGPPIQERPHNMIFSGVYVHYDESVALYRIVNDKRELAVRDVVKMVGSPIKTDTKRATVHVRWFTPGTTGRLIIWAETETQTGVERHTLASEDITGPLPTIDGLGVFEVELNWPEGLESPSAVGFSVELSALADVGVAVLGLDLEPGSRHTRSVHPTPTRTFRKKPKPGELVDPVDLSHYGPYSVAIVSWQDFQGDESGSTRVFPPDERVPFARLVIENTSNEQAVFPLTVIDSPKLPSSTYIVLGQIAYRDVAGEAYLEMWNHFPSGEAYFTRTLADKGTMARLNGTGGWRTFTLPFKGQPGGPPPTKLEINLILPGRGVVEIGPMFLSDNTTAPALPPKVAAESVTVETPISETEDEDEYQPKLPDYFAGMLPFVVIILLGWALAFVFWLMRNRHPGLAVNGLRALVVCSAGLLVLAIVIKQVVIVAIVACALLVLVSGLFLYDALRRRSRQAELRKMSAMDRS